METGERPSVPHGQASSPRRGRLPAWKATPKGSQESLSPTRIFSFSSPRVHDNVPTIAHF